MTMTHALGSGIVLQQSPQFVQNLLSNFLAALPSIIAAIVILIIGWIVGAILGGIVKRIIRGIGLSQHVEGTPLDSGDDVEGSLANGLGKLVKYIVIFLALLLALDRLGLAIPAEFLNDIANGVVLIIVALAILVVGFAIGRAVGGIVASIINGFGVDSYLSGTPLSDTSDSVGGIGNAVGKIVEYVIYFLALLIALDYVGIAIPADVLADITNAVLRIVVAAIILVVGFAIGRFVGDLVGDLLSGFGFDRYLSDTPLSRVTDAVGGVGNAIGKIVEYIIYYFALVQAVDALQFGILTRMFNGLTAYLPVLIGSIIILLIGIYVADLLGDLIASADASKAADYAGLGVKVFVYYVTITIVLNRLGLEVEVLQTAFTAAVTAFFGALGLGLAIAIGIGLGWGSKDFVANNIDDWFGSAKDSASDMTDESGSSGSSSSSGRSGGTDDEFESLGSDDDSGPGGSGPSGTGGSSD